MKIKWINIIILSVIIQGFCLSSVNCQSKSSIIDLIGNVHPDQVTSLDLHNKNLRELPEDIYLLQNLEYLVIAENHISALPKRFKDLKN